MAHPRVVRRKTGALSAVARLTGPEISNPAAETPFKDGNDRLNARPAALVFAAALSSVHLALAQVPPHPQIVLRNGYVNIKQNPMILLTKHVLREI